MIFNRQPSSREELYQRIRESSKDAVIREEMIRLGYWKPDAAQPQLANDWMEEHAALTKELQELYRRTARMQNREQLLADIRKKRMAESREKQKQNKLRREAERKARAERWAQTQAKDIIYLGEGVSGGLNERQTRPELLAQNQLPVYMDAESLAVAMGISVGQLRFLSFHRKVAKTSHYRRFLLPKKSGGTRKISAPMPRLKRLQYWILHTLLYQLDISEQAHGFVPERSIKSNAQAHVGQDVVINLDFKDFFPTITYPRVKGLFGKLGYSEQIATIFALLCTEPEIQEAQMDGESWFIQQGERKLPQGAPTSPAITNIICRRFDRRLQGAAQKLGFQFTRYADDLTLSASGEAVKDLGRMLWQTRKIIEEEGFVLHPDKLRVMRKGMRQEVTGIVVNEGLGVERHKLRAFKALLFQIEKDGPVGKSWQGQSDNLLERITGYADFIAMVDPAKGKAFQTRVAAICQKEQYQRRPKPEPKPKIPPARRLSNQPPPLPTTPGKASPPPLPSKTSGSPTPKKSFWEKLMFWKS
ncbi:reverse transcriptase domain-containing protein [Cerasicoccus fimbriatus]|uniref:reverse transcriptase domain-containing protein n=1 Tax=Cerasicoccus fimbriatus TaxID=3014554 RepID=UPI0022B33425|nr:reverse transcriptase domain-containing protein [Cerasicoccus sp. TK19100]